MEETVKSVRLDEVTKKENEERREKSKKINFPKNPERKKRNKKPRLETDSDIFKIVIGMFKKLKDEIENCQRTGN